jgi:hypothetical protein
MITFYILYFDHHLLVGIALTMMLDNMRLMHVWMWWWHAWIGEWESVDVNTNPLLPVPTSSAASASLGSIPPGLSLSSSTGGGPGGAAGGLARTQSLASAAPVATNLGGVGGLETGDDDEEEDVSVPSPPSLCYYSSFDFAGILCIIA